MKPKLLIIIEFTLLLAAFMFLSACHKPIPQKNEINKIEIARGSGIRNYPIVGIIIDSTLSYKFYGGYGAKPKGYYQGKITQAFWDTLNVKLKRINFKKLDTLVYDGSDNVEVIFYWDGQIRHIHATMIENSDRVDSVYKWIIGTYKSVRLFKSKDSIKFQTTYQYDYVTWPPYPEYDKAGHLLPPKYHEK